MALSHHHPPIYSSKDVRTTGNKVSSYVSHEDWQLINSVVAQSGAISFIIDHAIRHTAEAIRSNKLTPIVDTSRFLNWLRAREFTGLNDGVCKRTVGEPPSAAQGPSGDDAGRASGARQPATNPSDVAASVGSDDASGRGGGRRKARGAKA